jgi:uncharacterized membrane protein
MNVNPQPSQRLAVVDLARGLAIAQMVAYHFVYDLNYFGWVSVNVTQEPGWILWRNAIVSQFLLLVGIGVGLGRASGRSEWRFWQRWWQIAAAAALVSVVSAWLFGPRWIWFGILQFVALALLLVRPLTRLGAINLAIGAALLALGLFVSDSWFDPPMRSWIGFSAHKPATEDYVPVFPWLGVVVVGIGAAALWRRRESAPGYRPLDVQMSPARLLQFLGRWPLTIYLVHQPMLMGALLLIQRLDLGRR